MEKKEPIKKGGNKKGQRTQKMIAFRLDLDLVPFLESVTNKGRFINNLLRNHFRTDKPRFFDSDAHPDENTIEDNLT